MAEEHRIPQAGDPEKPYLFVSYSHKDEERVLDIIQTLQERCGLNIWFDRGMHSGDTWKAIAGRRLSHPNCRLVLFFMSANAMKSDAVAFELKRAAKLCGKRIIPVSLTGMLPDAIFAQITAEHGGTDEWNDYANYYDDIQAAGIGDDAICIFDSAEEHEKVCEQIRQDVLTLLREEKASVSGNAQTLQMIEHIEAYVPPAAAEEPSELTPMQALREHAEQHFQQHDPVRVMASYRQSKTEYVELLFTEHSESVELRCKADGTPYAMFVRPDAEKLFIDSALQCQALIPEEEAFEIITKFMQFSPLSMLAAEADRICGGNVQVSYSPKLYEEERMELHFTNRDFYVTLRNRKSDGAPYAMILYTHGQKPSYINKPADMVTLTPYPAARQIIAKHLGFE